ncbi:MAG: outer membrane beta-barrel protein [bacterium]|nr:outer membrane beta-barrel protein [bacterium]
MVYAPNLMFLLQLKTTSYSEVGSAVIRLGAIQICQRGINGTTSSTGLQLSRNRTDRGGKHTSAFANWKHRFAQDDHILTFDANFGGRDGQDEVTTEQFSESGQLLSGVRTEEGGPPTSRLEVKTDYVRPLANNRKIEAGLSSQFGKIQQYE